MRLSRKPSDDQPAGERPTTRADIYQEDEYRPEHVEAGVYAAGVYAAMGTRDEPADAIAARRPDHPEAAWAPVVIGTEIPPFAPRPAPLGQSVYRPDTICDAWSTAHLTVRLASIRGYSHRYGRTRRQDEAVVVFHPETESVVFAIADGVSNSDLSDIGAAMACHVAVRAALSDLDESHRVDWAKAVHKAASALIRRASSIRQQDLNADQAGELLATTLVLGMVRPGAAGANATLVQVGDSSAWTLRAGQYAPVLDEKTNAAAVVMTSAVRALPNLPARITPVHVEIPPDAVLLVGTDGFGDPLGDGSGAVGRVFARGLAVPPPALGLAHLLDFSRETFDDDRTLLAIWPTGAR